MLLVTYNAKFEYSAEINLNGSSLEITFEKTCFQNKTVIKTLAFCQPNNAKIKQSQQ